MAFLEARTLRVGRVALLHVLLLGLCHPHGPGVGARAGFACPEGCKKGFQPVCGEDLRTYATPCVATCQGISIAHYGPCPGEPILHPANLHVVTGASTSSPPASTSGKAAHSAATSTTPSAASAVLTQHHLDAFRREGFRYAGQVTLSNTMAPRGQHTPRPGPSPAAGPDGQAQQPRVVRVTREGHLYTADLDDHVDTVLDSLIEGHANATAGATGAYVSAAHAAQVAHAHAMLLSLRQWRAYQPRGTGRANGGSHGGGSKWPAPHTVVASRGAAGGAVEHPLQPVVLDETGMAGGFVAQRKPAGRAEAAAGPQPEQEQVEGSADASVREVADTEAKGQAAATGAGPSSGKMTGENAQDQNQGAGSKWSWGFGLGFGAGQKRSKQTAQQQQAAGADGASGSSSGGSGGRSVGFHRMVRRNLGIFDTDDRVDCPRTPAYPFSAVGQINIRDPAGNYVCSGALVGPDVVLTAAHCVFNRAAQTFYAKLDFAPGRYRTVDGLVVNPYGVVAWSYVTVYQGYSSPTSADPNVQDIAVINLSERIGTQAGWMGVFEPCSPYAPTRYVALTAGYPSDQPAGSCKTTQCVVVQEPCTDGYLYHKCDTASGQSGSPMYMMAMTNSNKMGPYIRGVHNIEWVQENSNGQMVSYINSAVSITPDHYRSILAWIGLSFAVDGSTPMGPALPPPGSPATFGSNDNSTASTGRR